MRPGIKLPLGPIHTVFDQVRWATWLELQMENGQWETGSGETLGPSQQIDPHLASELSE